MYLKVWAFRQTSTPGGGVGYLDPPPPHTNYS